MAEYCSACTKLKELNPEFVLNGITTIIYNSLKNNTGLKASLGHDNCEDLNDLNDCLIGYLKDILGAKDVCDWREFMDAYLENQYIINKALVASDCGQWEQIKAIWEDIKKIWIEIGKLWSDSESQWIEINNLKTQVTNILTEITNIWKKITELENILIDREGYVTVTKIYTYIVSKDKFIRGVSTVNSSWWSGSVGKGESFISIPISDMDFIDAVIAQPQVVGGHPHAVTVAIQENYREGNNFIVNFDTYEIENDAAVSLPFAVPITFIVLGRKKVR